MRNHNIIIKLLIILIWIYLKICILAKDDQEYFCWFFEHINLTVSFYAIKMKSLQKIIKQYVRHRTLKMKYDKEIFMISFLHFLFGYFKVFNNSKWENICLNSAFFRRVNFNDCKFVDIMSIWRLNFVGR